MPIEKNSEITQKSIPKKMSLLIQAILWQAYCCNLRQNEKIFKSLGSLIQNIDSKRRLLQGL
jgi:hypothetical protein